MYVLFIPAVGPLRRQSETQTKPRRLHLLNPQTTLLVVLQTAAAAAPAPARHPAQIGRRRSFSHLPAPSGREKTTKRGRRTE